MSFHYPQAFYFFIPYAGILLLYTWSRWARKRDLLKIGDWSLIRYMLQVECLGRRRNKDAVALGALLILILAATGPQFGATMKEVKQRGVDVFVAIDTSRSMLAEDVPPTRMDHAKRSLGLLIEKLAGNNRVGIIAFAGYAVIQCPLTTDADAARMFLDIVDTHTVPRQGTSIGDAIRLASKSFNKDDKVGKALVLLTDGEDHESNPVEAAKTAKEAGLVIFTIGIGTNKGEVIKDRDDEGKVTGFHKFKGEMVMSRMDDALLTKIAQITGGRFYLASSTDREIEEIADELNGFDKKEFASKLYQRREERYQIFLLMALLLLLIEFFIAENPGQFKRIKDRMTKKLVWPKFKIPRMKNISACLLVVIFVTTAQADVRSLVREGCALAKKGDMPGARQQFEQAAIDAPEAPFIPYNIGTTYYLEGKFDDAKKQYERALAMTHNPDLESKIHYNLGHLAFTQGNREGAIKEFMECLKKNPTDVDAKYNIEYIKAGKTPKNPPPKPNPSQSPNQNQQGNGQGQQGQDKKDQIQEKKKGDLSKEDADRILQMMKDQEKDKIKNAKQMEMGNQKKDKKDDINGEDW